MIINETPATHSPTVDQALQQAISCHQAHNLREAERLYRIILAVEPRHPDAHHNLGVLAVQMNQTAAGLPHFKTALEERPHQTQYWLSYIDALIRDGQPEAAQQFLAQGRQLGLKGVAVDMLERVLLQESRPMTSDQDYPDIPDMNRVVALISQESYIEAEILAEEMTSCFPRHFFGWKALGAIFRLQGRIQESLEPMQKAAALLPGDPEAHNNLGTTLREMGQLDEAVACFCRALEIKPDFAEAYNNRGITLIDLGRSEEAAISCRRALEIRPEFTEAHINLGLALQKLGQLDEAERCYRQAINIKPNFAEVHSNLGNVLRELGRIDECELSYRRALEIKPDYVEAYYNLGNALHKQGRLEESEQCYRCAMLHNPDYVEAHYNLGVTMQELGRLEESEGFCRSAIALKPDYAEAHNNLGSTLQKMGRLKEAEACYSRALEIKPDYAEAHYNTGFALHIMGRLKEAEACYRSALEIKPDYAEAHNNLGNTLKDLGRLEEAEASHRRSLEIKPDYAMAYSNLLFNINYAASHYHPSFLEEARAWETRCIPETTRSAARTRQFNRSPLAGRRLRVGYVSGDFRHHAVSYFIEQLFSHHDKTRVELFAYSANGRSDAVTERMKALVEHWVQVATLSDQKLLAQIETDQIDLLIDLSGHTAHNRLGLFAHRAAPVQAHWLGYFASTGLTEMDYWIGDPILTPPETECQFSETVWRLPRTWISYEGKREAPESRWQPSPDGTLWLGSFNNLGKLTPATLAMWAKLLHKLPEARLLLKTKELAEERNRQRILDTFALHGIETERIELQDNRFTIEWSAHMAYYDRIDIALDPIGGIGGGTTTCDALWMGVPVISLTGDRMASRMTASMLAAIERNEWLATTEEEYIAKVVALAHDSESRTAMRTDQRNRMATSPLCDARGLACALEDAYEVMFERCLMRTKTDTISIGNLSVTQRENPNLTEIDKLMALFNQGSYAEVELLAREITECFPQDGFGWKVLGAVLDSQGRTEESLEPLLKAATLMPGDAEAQYNMGVTHNKLGRLKGAVDSYRLALEIRPDYAEAHINLGNSLNELGLLEEAEASYHRALEIRPDYAKVHYNLGNNLKELGRLVEAEASYHRALEISPDYAEAYSNLGATLNELGRLEEAEASYHRALEIRPDYAEAHYNLGNNHKELGYMEGAESCYRHALEIKPDYAEAYSNLLFVLNYAVNHNLPSYLEEARAWDTRCIPEAVRSAARMRQFSRSPLAGRRLRVGYVSGDFRHHAVSYFIEQLFSHHDKTRVELFAYSANGRSDAITEQMKALVEHWVPVATLSDQKLLAQIETDQIDLLIDLSGHTAHNRLGLFAHRAAPVQAHWLGYFASTGLTEMDYWIGDPILTPPETDYQFSETVWRLPRTWISYEGKREAPESRWQPSPDGTLWLGSFNNLGKLTPATLAMWAKLLHKLPEARLLLKTKELAEDLNRQRILDAFAGHGIGPERIELQDNRITIEWSAHMAYYDRIDIALDPIGGIGGGTTTCDALWMGVPVVSLVGDRMASRMTASMLAALERPEWLATSEDEYVSKVVALAQDSEGRRVMRGIQRERMATSPLCDSKGLALALEDAFESMFERWRVRTKSDVTSAAAVSVTQLQKDAEAHEKQGIIFQKLGRFEASEACFRRALEMKPDYVEAYYNLGSTLYALGRLEEAELSIRRALEIRPDFAEAQYNLGFILSALNRMEESEACYRRALEIRPDYAEAHNNLGFVLNDFGRLEEAEASYRRALEIKPEYADANYNLGNTLYELARLYESEALLRRALEIKPDYAEAHNNLGNLLKDLGRLEEAEACFRRALEIKSDFAMAHSNLLLTLNYSVSHNHSYLLEEALKYGQMVAQKVTARFSTWICEPHPKRLRVGIVSGDLYNHPVGYFLESLLAQIDQSVIELIAYPTVNREDELSTRIRPFFSAWKTLAGLNDETAARLIHADGVNLLLDLSGHTAKNRLPVFAWKPAPVQAHWLGYSNTTGVAEMDYQLGDPYVIPEEEECHYSEKVWRLPECYLCFTSPDSEPEVGPLPALTIGCITFGCFNNLAKISDAAVALWARVLLAIPGSRLFLKTKQLGELTVCETMRRRFAAHGIEPYRLILAGATATRTESLAMYQRVDIALDPFPYNGGTTSIESLWMGVPLIIRRGNHSLSHIGESIASNAGLADWIAENDDDYVAKAVMHSTHLERLATIREGLRQQVLGSPLFDAPRFARHFEAALWGMWTQWNEQHESSFHQSNPDSKEIDTLLALFNQGRYLEAEQRAREITTLFPQFAFGWKVLGGVFKAVDRTAEALEPMKQAAMLLPEDVEAHSNLGIIFKELGRFEEAEASSRRALEIRPDFVEALHNLGNTLRDLGRLEESETYFRRALEINPDNAELYNNLGITLKEMGRPEEATASIRTALKIKPDYAPAHSNLGIVLRDLGQFVEAVACYRRALEIDPDFAEVHSNLGLSLKELGHLEEAEASYHRALEIKPDYAEAFSNLGNALDDLGRPDEAEVCYRRALTFKPDYAAAYSNLLFSINYAASHYLPSHLEEARAWETRCIRESVRTVALEREFCRSPLAGRRLRVGYISGDFRHHAVSYFIEQLFSHHDTTRVEVCAYSANGRHDAITGRIKAVVEHWVPVAGLSDQKLLERIEADQIDVLIDLSGHTAHNRLGLFAHRAAPVQAHWLGYFATTGLTEMDYWIGDQILTPPETDYQFSETVWRLPRTWISYEGKREAPESRWRPSPDGTLWLGSFNNLSKLTPATLALWALLLHKLPDARLLLKTKELAEERNRQRILDTFALHGIGPERIELQDNRITIEWSAHMAYYDRLDIALDPVGGVGGGTTTCDALWMGVPVVSLIGDRMASRMTASMLAAIERNEWLATSEYEYVEKVVASAQDSEGRRVMRGSQRERMATSPLCDAKGLARTLEDAFEAMFEKWFSSRFPI